MTLTYQPAPGTPVTFAAGGAYEDYEGEFIREVDGKALVVVNSPEEMVVMVAYEQVVIESPQRDIWDEADEAYAAHKEDPDNW